MLGQLDRIESRTVIFTDTTGKAGLTAPRLDAVEKTGLVEWTAAFGPTSDVRNARLGAAGKLVPSRASYSALPPVLRLVAGRSPREGEALVGVGAADDLGLSDGAGALLTEEGRLISVVGVFDAVAPLASLNDSALVSARAGRQAPVRTLVAVVNHVTDVGTASRVVPGVLTVTTPRELTVHGPDALADIRKVIAGELGGNARRLMLLTLALGMVLTSVTQFGAVASRRRDYGRQRALGASRGDLATVVFAQVIVCSGTGAALGVGFGYLTVHLLDGSNPPLGFSIGVAILVVLSAIVAAVVPAAAAMRADPVRILRVP
ncbi:FtsX-like permease family protein [Nocardioides sp. S5]|uniref:FtsX-like permease family protein n=1 Tax=Nocardioides sp. S5 TaxID=2017486 RepID=UPI001A8DB487|nr:FtsX-like permease family protein [Nocardioides sp. S5]